MREGEGTRGSPSRVDVIPSEARDLAGERSEPAAKIPRSARDDNSPLFELTNIKKVFWPEEGYTKGDLIDYYRAVSPWLLAYLRNRPLVMTRYPDGIGGKSFFQKDAPGFTPGLDPHRADVERGHPARDRLLRV